MKRIDLILIVGFAFIVGLFTLVGYNRIIEAAYNISTAITPNVKVAEPPVLPTTSLQVVNNYDTQDTINPQIVGENATNNWGQ